MKIFNIKDQQYTAEFCPEIKKKFLAYWLYTKYENIKSRKSQLGDEYYELLEKISDRRLHWGTKEFFEFLSADMDNLIQLLWMAICKHSETPCSRELVRDWVNDPDSDADTIFSFLIKESDEE